MENILDVIQIMAWSSTAILMIMLMASLVGADLIEVDFDPEGNFAFLIFTIFLLFLSGFSWGFLANYKGDEQYLIPSSIGFLQGIGFIVLFRALFKLVKSMETESRSKDIFEAGLRGKIMLTIPAGGQVSGKVQLPCRGALREFNAFTKSAEGLATGTLVSVASHENGVLIVECLS